MRIKKTIKEKCISALIVMCMVLGLVHTEFATVSVKAAGITVDSEGDFGSETTYTGGDLSDIAVTKVNAGEYTLTSDITLSKPLYIAAGDTVTIILDGKNISRGFEDASSGTKDGMVIINDGTLTLGSPTQTGGTATGGYVSVTGFAGGVNVGLGNSSAKLTNYITISSNKSATAGGVYVAYGSVFDNYGRIEYNTGNLYGGGVKCNGTFTNYSTGVIANNKAKNGGGIIIGSNSVATNYGVISNNTATNNGGGVDVNGYTSLFINGGTINNNRAEYSGGGISNGGSTDGYGVKLLDNTVITGNTARNYGGGICGTGHLFMSGKVIITDNKRGSVDSTVTDNLKVYMSPDSPSYGRLIKFEGALLEGSIIGVNGTAGPSDSTCVAGVITQGYQTGVPSGELKYFIKDGIQDKSKGYVLIVNQSNELEFVQHSHSWTGVADGNLLKYYCTKTDSKCEYYGADLASVTNVLTLTLNASNMNYNGSQYNGVSTSWNDMSYSTYLSIYYEGVGNTSYSKTETAPVDAGRYKATVTYNGVTAETEFDINKINQSSDLEITMSDYVYNQSEALPTPSINGTVNGGATVKYYYNTTDSTSGGAEWKDIDSTSLPIGTYYMYAVIEATNNYNEYVTATVPFDVHAANMTGITVENVDVTYDGEDHGIDITGVPQGATIKYGTSEGTYTLDECPTYKDASTEAYVIYYQVTLPGYNTYTGSATVKINPVVVDVIWGETTFVYDGQAHSPQADVTGIITGDTCSVTVNGEETDAGTGYQAEAVIDNSNYKINEAHKYVTFEITKAIQNAPQVEGVDETVLGKADGKISGLTTSMEYRTENSSEYEAITSEDMTFEPGKYYVRYAETSNYNSSEETEVVIGEGEVLTVSLPTEQVGYNISVDKQTLMWQEGYEVTFSLAEGYRKTDEFVIKINDLPISLSEDNKYAASLVECDQVITVTGVEKIIPPVALGLVDGKTYCHDVEFEVEEGSSYRVYVDGYEVELRDGKYTISVGNIDVNPEVSDYETHVIRIVEDENNVTEYTITVTSHHEYEEPEFSWSDDNSSVTVTSKCIHDDEHVVTVTEDTDMDIIQQATETVDGKVEYTVTVVIDGVEYTSKKIVEKSIDDEVFKDNEPSKDEDT